MKMLLTQVKKPKPGPKKRKAREALARSSYELSETQQSKTVGAVATPQHDNTKTTSINNATSQQLCVYRVEEEQTYAVPQTNPIYHQNKCQCKDIKSPGAPSPAIRKS